MNKFLKYSTLAITGVIIFVNSFIVNAQSPSTKTPISIFERAECVHCQEELAFLDELKKTRDDFEVLLIDINTADGRDLWGKFAEQQKISKVTPITLVGNIVIQGFDTKETTGKRIEEILNASKGKKTLTVDEFMAAGGSGGNIEKVEGTCDENGLEPCDVNPSSSEYLVNIPFFGAVDLEKYSLPALSATLGFVDGFNPCAMWVLVTFLIVLIDAGSRKRMWQLAGIFILAEAVMYYMILNVWFTAWDFVGLNNIITPIVGLIAIGAGGFFLYEWWNSDGTCKVTTSTQKVKTREKIKKLVQTEITIFSILGILGLAFSVNIIEFACSIGIPQTFTKIVELNGLDFWTTQFYMAIYILMYMIDDIIVFGIALYSFEKIGITSKYAKWSHFIGGGLMLILGLILLINPELLIFG